MTSICSSPRRREVEEPAERTGWVIFGAVMMITVRFVSDGGDIKDLGDVMDIGEVAVVGIRPPRMRATTLHE